MTGFEHRGGCLRPLLKKLRKWNFLDPCNIKILSIKSANNAEQSPSPTSARQTSLSASVSAAMHTGSRNSTSFRWFPLYPRCGSGRKATFTLAEGATHVAQSAKPRRAAFTLAEVLITLGIIGVVAAMTLPALIQNYQKGVALNRLKQTFSQLQTGAEAVSAEFDTLPMHKWSCEEGPGDEDYDQESCFYLIPKKMGAKMYERVADADKVMCYEGKPYRPYKNLRGEDIRPFSTYSWSAQMPNGACVLWMAYAYTGDERGVFYIDVDGPYSGYNTVGKDLFNFRYSRPNDGHGLGNSGWMLFPGSSNVEGAEAENVQMWSNYDLFRGCSKRQNSDGYTCSAKIIRDGWQMDSDYPWK